MTYLLGELLRALSGATRLTRTRTRARAAAAAAAEVGTRARMCCVLRKMPRCRTGSAAKDVSLSWVVTWLRGGSARHDARASKPFSVLILNGQNK